MVEQIGKGIVDISCEVTKEIKMAMDEEEKKRGKARQSQVRIDHPGWCTLWKVLWKSTETPNGGEIPPEEGTATVTWICIKHIQDHHWDVGQFPHGLPHWPNSAQMINTVCATTGSEGRHGFKSHHGT